MREHDHDGNMAQNEEVNLHPYGHKKGKVRDQQNDQDKGQKQQIHKVK